MLKRFPIRKQKSVKRDFPSIGFQVKLQGRTNVERSFLVLPFLESQLLQYIDRIFMAVLPYSQHFLQQSDKLNFVKPHRIMKARFKPFPELLEHCPLSQHNKPPSLIYLIVSGLSHIFHFPLGLLLQPSSFISPIKSGSVIYTLVEYWRMCFNEQDE